MSSKISSIYDSLITLISGQLTTYARIPDPYSQESNSGLFLQKGFAIGFGPASNTERFVNCHFTIERTFFLLLANQFTTTENNVTARGILEKNLFEDQYKIIKALENDSDLGGYAIKAFYSSDNGIEFDESKRYMILITDITCEYLENL